MGTRKQTIHDFTEDQQALAELYAQDGAFSSAARVMRQLASKLEDYAGHVHEDLLETAKKEGSN